MIRHSFLENMKEIIFRVEQEADGGFVAEARINEDEQIITQGDNLEELKVMIKDALECHFENLEQMPGTVRLHFIKEEVFAI